MSYICQYFIIFKIKIDAFAAYTCNTHQLFDEILILYFFLT